MREGPPAWPRLAARASHRRDRRQEGRAHHPLDQPPRSVHLVLPTAGVLVPEKLDGELTLRVLLSEEAERSRESLSDFAASYRAVPADLIPELRTQRRLDRSGPVSRALRDVTDVICHGRPASTTKTVQVLTSNIPIDQLTKAADGGGLRGFRRGARGIAEQARLQVQQVEVVTSSGRRVAISTSKAGLVIGGVAIGWSALLAAGAFTALDMKAQADRRAHEDRVETLLGGCIRRPTIAAWPPSVRTSAHWGNCSGVCWMETRCSGQRWKPSS